MIIKKLEKYASILEDRGMKKQAFEIDLICNSIEKAAFKFPWTKKKEQDKAELEQLIGDRVKSDNKFLANKIEIYDRQKNFSSEGRVRTKNPPKEFKNKFVEGPDGYWYLQDDRAMSVQKFPDKMVLYDDSKDLGVPVQGLEIM